MKVTTSWKANMAFNASVDEHVVTMDTTVDKGGDNLGMSPKQMLLASLCGCSGMDVVSILEKMRVVFTRLEISAEAEQTEEHPKVFKSVQMVYTSDINAADLDKLEKAIMLSHTKYCGISAMLGKHCAITHTAKISGQ